MYKKELKIEISDVTKQRIDEVILYVALKDIFSEMDRAKSFMILEQIAFLLHHDITALKIAYAKLNIYINQPTKMEKCIATYYLDMSQKAVYDVLSIHPSTWKKNVELYTKKGCPNLRTRLDEETRVKCLNFIRDFARLFANAKIFMDLLDKKEE